MTGSSGWTPPGSSLPPGWSPRQPPPYTAGRTGWPGPPGPAPPRPPFVPPEPKPGIVALRPLGLGEILDGAISYIRQNPRATLGLAAIVATFSAGLQLAAAFVMMGEIADVPPTGTLEPEQLVNLFSGTLVTAAVGAVVGFLAQAVLTGMLTAVVGRAVLGRHIGIGEVWRDVRPRILPLLGLAVTMTLIYIVIVAIVAVPVTSLAAAGAGPAATAAVGVLLGVGALVTAVWLYVGFALAMPALVLERAGVIAALGRSWTLVRRSFWRTLAILVLTGIIAFVVGSVLQIPFTVPRLLLAVNPDAWTFKVALVIAALGSIVAGTVVAPFSAGVRALLYVDQRMRREGLDIALHGAAAGPGADEHEPPSPWLTSIGAARQGPRPPSGPYRGPPIPPPPGGKQGW